MGIKKPLLLMICGLIMFLILASCTKPQATPPFNPDTMRIREIDGAVEIYIPAGDFLMGRPTSDNLAMEDQTPQHTVNLDAYWIDQHEITNAQYAQCVALGVCREPYLSKSDTRSNYYGDPQYANYPVIYVGWDMANIYCQWVGGGLPTEAQWEKAACGADGCIFPWGDEAPNADLLNYNSNVGDTTAVCSYLNGNSPYGACDMAGNVWEWVNDWIRADYYSLSPISNPTGPANGERKVQRGGSWDSGSKLGSGAILVRSTNRGWRPPDVGENDTGFRCRRNEAP
jgi:formylglycine-generating enzyme required for sulfatase activity